MIFLSLLVILGSAAHAGESGDLSACRAKIRSSVCLVDPAEPGSDDESGAFKRPCLAGSEFYAPVFEAHFDRAPELIQRMYCHLSRIFVEKEFVGTAFASYQADALGNIVAGGVGIRRDVLDIAIGMDRWLSWKEEASYGGSRSPEDAPLGVFHYRSLDSSHEFFIDYVLAHEFGHLFDFANELNGFDDCRYEEDVNREWHPVGACTPKAGSFSELSWERVDRARGLDEYPLRTAQCSYFCNGRSIPRDQSAEMFRQLMRTSFVSPYASRMASEDWAETFAVYLVSQERGWRWGVETQNVVFDLSAHFESDLLRSKREYVRRFLAKPFLYPGETGDQIDRVPMALRMMDVQSL